MTARTIHKDGVDYPDPRGTRAWYKLRDQVVREEPTCRLRFPGICTTASTTGDHIQPVETHPELGLVRTNVRGACAECNRARGTTPDSALNTDGPPPALSIFGK